MISSRLVARAFGACLGFMLVASSARAQFAECELPSNVPETVFITIAENGDLAFGDLDQTVCDSIVKKGVATCKAQVKGAAKCGHKATDGLYSILSKQCATIEDAVARAECKESVKTFRSFNLEGYTSSKEEGLETCETDFAEALNAECMALVMKTGTP